MTGLASSSPGWLTVGVNHENERNGTFPFHPTTRTAAIQIPGIGVGFIHRVAEPVHPSDRSKTAA